jgi:hypothetical protein
MNPKRLDRRQQRAFHRSFKRNLVGNIGNHRFAGPGGAQGKLTVLSGERSNRSRSADVVVSIAAVRTVGLALARELNTTTVSTVPKEER